MNLQNLKNNKILAFLKIFDTVEFLGLILMLFITFMNIYNLDNKEDYYEWQFILLLFSTLELLIQFYNTFINRTIFTFISKFIVFKEYLNFDKVFRILIVDFSYFLSAVLTFFIFTMVIGDYFYESIGVTDKYLTFGLIYLLLIIMSIIGERKYYRQMYKDLNGKYPNNKKRKNKYAINSFYNTQ